MSLSKMSLSKKSLSKNQRGIPSPKNILFQMSGSIACYKSCHIISRWIKDGHQVQVVCTSSALKFIGEATLEGLTGRPVISDTFQSGHLMDHIHLARWADLAILCPATANQINLLANGIANNPIGALALAIGKDKPYILVPAMNHNMYSHPSVKSSLKKLSSWGIDIIDCDEGSQACGEFGPGRLKDPEEIISYINSRYFCPENSPGPIQNLSKNDIENPKLRVLITSGGTRESIDGVRYITNLSTGKTGSFIADAFHTNGHHVTYLHALLSNEPQSDLNKQSFESFLDLDQSLKNILSNENFDVVIHLAAVSDFSVEKIVQGSEVFAPSKETKIRSDKDLSIYFERNFKIVDKIRSYSKNKNLTLIAFKLTNTSDLNEVKNSVNNLLSSSGANFVVHNDVNDITANKHSFSIYQVNGTKVFCENKGSLSENLIQICKNSTTSKITNNPSQETGAEL